MLKLDVGEKIDISTTPRSLQLNTIHDVLKQKGMFFGLGG